MKKLVVLNEDGEFFQYKSGGLVYIISPLTGLLRTSPRKISLKYVGPVVIYKITDPKSFILCTLDGTSLWVLFEHETLKSATI